MLFGAGFVIAVPLCLKVLLVAPHDADMRKAHMRTPRLARLGAVV